MINSTPGKTDKWIATNGHSPVSVFFNTIHPIPPDAVELIDKETFPVSVQKGKYLLKPGHTGDFIYLILKGVMRAFIKESGKEITTWINEENEIVGSIRSLGLHIPSDEYLQ